jgi:hypothetical protein
MTIGGMGTVAVSGSRTLGRRCFGSRGCRRFGRLAVLGLEVLLAQAAGTVAVFTAFLEGAGFVARFGHLAGPPESIMLAAVAFADRLARAIFRFAISFVRHESLLGSRIPATSAGLYG